ncbi:MAG TPA: phosphomannomutase/phosphoglucomutase, partial [Methylomicrobium sp.]|nr:phosphomannomutase/phosphoglucomutase [Methylomicrobium sp.]
MFRLFTFLAAMAMLLFALSGGGIFWIATSAISQSKLDSVGALAKGIGLSITAQIELINQTLDSMSQDGETLQALASGNPTKIENAAKRISDQLPNVFNVRLLLPGITELEVRGNAPMTYADLNMVREAFAASQNPLPAIQGDAPKKRHLAIARKIVQGGQTIGVLLASFDGDFIRKNLLLTQVDDGYIQLHQAKLILGAAGFPPNKEYSAGLKIPVANTDWELSYGVNDSSITLDSGL